MVSGLALAEILELPYIIHWPENNWCKASFQDIFSNNYLVSKQSISDLKGTLSDAVVLLHDEITANIIGTEFKPAYNYSSAEDLINKSYDDKKRLFYYPALIPSWISKDKVRSEFKKIKIYKIYRR